MPSCPIRVDKLTFVLTHVAVLREERGQRIKAAWADQATP